MSTLRLTRLALPELRKSGRGRVVNITSSAVKEPNEGLLLSNVYRPGVTGWAKTLSQDEGPNGITVNSIAPGYIDTDRMKNIYAMGDDPAGDRARRRGPDPGPPVRRPGRDRRRRRLPLLDARGVHQRHHGADRRRAGQGAPELRLTGKTIVVTGGSSGLGRAMSLAFAAEGAHVVVGDIRDGAARGWRADGRRDRCRRRAARSTCTRTFPPGTTSTGWSRPPRPARGRLDVMVPNAVLAGRHSKGLLETEPEDWEAIMAVGLRGVFLCCKRAVQQMLGQEPIAEARGRIINISSQHGMVGPPGHVAYAAAKGGVVNLTRQVAVDFGPRGIIVNAIAPGKILTTPIDEPDSPETLAYSHARTPFPRLGRPEDVAAAAVFLASDECSYVSGTNLLVDGGWMAY